MKIKNILQTSWLKHFGAIALYSIAFIFLTWPLIKNIGTGILGYYGSDSPIFLWNVWEWKNKLSTGDFGYLTRDIFYPNFSSIILHTHTFIQSIFAVLINFIVRNLTLSFNLTYWLSAVSGAFFTYLFFLKKTKNYFASLLAGQIFGFQHLWAVYSLYGTQNIISFWYIPAALCAYAYWQENYQQRYLCLNGIILGLAWLNDFNMFAFTAGTLGIYIFATYILERQKIVKIIQQLAIIFFSFILIAGWNISYILQHRQEIVETNIPSISDVDYYHADPINLIRPSHSHLLWPNLNNLFTTKSSNQGNAFLGFTSLFIFLLFIIFWIRTKQAPDKKPFILYTILFLVILSLSFGPFLHLAGVHTPLPMPYYFISKIVTQFNNLRVPMRWLIPSMFFFAGILAFALKYIFEKVSLKIVMILSFVIFGGFLLDSWLGPNQILIVNDYPKVNEVIKAKPGVVLELPLAISSGFYTVAEGARINQLHQVAHGQPIVGGTISRAPKNFIESYEKEPVMKYLLLYKNTLPDAIDLDKNNIHEFLSKYDVRYILFDKQLSTDKDTASKNLFNFIENKLKFSLFYEDDKVVAFELD